MDNLDMLLKNKYEKINVENLNEEYVYNILNKNEYRKNKYIYKVACLFIICVIFISIIVIKSGSFLNIEKIANDNVDDEYINRDRASKYENSNLPVASEEINLFESNASYATLKADYVLVVKIEKILEYTNYSEILNSYTYPVTKIKAKVINSLKGNIDENIEFCKQGGIISISDFEKTLTDEQIKKYGYDKKTKEEKDNTYVKVTSSIDLDMAKEEEGKTYLVTLRKDTKVYDSLITVGIFGMREFNIETNCIKDENSGKWENINENDILKEIIEN